MESADFLPLPLFLAPILQDWAPDLRSLALLLFNFLLLVLPGIGFTTWRASKNVAIRYPLIITILTSGVLGYVCFYTFLVSKIAGRFLVCLIYLTSVTLLSLGMRNRRSFRNLCRRVAEPLALTVLLAICYFSLTFLFINPMKTGASYLDGRFFSAERPGDNVIPFFFAQRIYDRKPLRPFCCGGWLSSDRPPLQAGLFLMERPLSLTSNVDLDYQLLATPLQCLWLCGVWCFLSSLGSSVLQIRRVLCLLAFSGILYYNSVYTWPKFLTATLVLFAASVLIECSRYRRQATYCDAAAASLSLGLALVSHAGSLFSLVALSVFLFRFRIYFPYRLAGLAVPIVLAFLLPWAAYQRFVDPPGNRLVKLHLAGVDAIGPSTPWAEIRNAYATHSFTQIVALRWSNFAMLFGHTPFDTLGLRDGGVPPGVALKEWNRILQERHLWNALGPLNLGWFAGLFLLTKKRRCRSIPYAAWLLLAAGIDILIWCLVEFGPGYGLVAHLSFADLLLLCVALCAFLLDVAPGLALATLALQLLNFFMVWIWSPPYAFSSWAGPNYLVRLQPLLLLVGVLSALGLLVHLGRSLFSGTTPATPESRPYT